MPRPIAILLLVAAFPALAISKKPVTIDALLNTPAASLTPVAWAPDGERFITTSRDEHRVIR